MDWGKPTTNSILKMLSKNKLRALAAAYDAYLFMIGIEAIRDESPFVDGDHTCDNIGILSHSRWMCQEIELYLSGGDVSLDKPNRWIGFIQGILFLTNKFSIKDFKDHVNFLKDSDIDNYQLAKLELGKIIERQKG